MKVRIFSLLFVFLATGIVSCYSYAPQEKGTVVVKSKKDKKGWLGVSLQDVTRKLARQKDLVATSGAYVTDVVDDSPAEEAGFEDGDVILQFEGRDVEDSDELTKYVRGTKPGTKVDIVVERDRQKKTLSAEIGRTKDVTSMWFDSDGKTFNFRVPKTPSVKRLPGVQVYIGSTSRFGLQAQKLTKQLAEYFQVPGKKGVLVTEVKKKSEADKAGLKAGDVITKAGSASVWDLSDLTDELKDLDEGDEITLQVFRNGQTTTLKLKSEQGEEDDDWMDNGNLNHYYYQFNSDDHPHTLEGLGLTIRKHLHEGLDETKKELEQLRYEIQSELDEL